MSCTRRSETFAYWQKPRWYRRSEAYGCAASDGGPSQTMSPTAAIVAVVAPSEGAVVLDELLPGSSAIATPGDKDAPVRQAVRSAAIAAPRRARPPRLVVDPSSRTWMLPGRERVHHRMLASRPSIDGDQRYGHGSRPYGHFVSSGRATWKWRYFGNDPPGRSKPIPNAWLSDGW